MENMRFLAQLLGGVLIILFSIPLMAELITLFIQGYHPGVHNTLVIIYTLLGVFIAGGYGLLVISRWRNSRNGRG